MCVLLVSGACCIWKNLLPPKVPSPPDPSGETAIARISGEVKNVHQRYDALAEVPKFFKGFFGKRLKKKSDIFFRHLENFSKKIRGMEDQELDPN